MARTMLNAPAEVSMDTKNKEFSQEIAALEQKRDELKVQLHLAKDELKDRWSKLEDKWLELQDKAKQVAAASDKSAHRVSDVAAETTKKLMQELRDGYKNIRDAL
jgi:hypothetical protein